MLHPVVTGKRTQLTIAIMGGVIVLRMHGVQNNAASGASIVFFLVCTHTCDIMGVH